ncbi:MAG: hypothetical protein ACI8XC_004476 [Gammaproteobacteria bacterium]|jgi:hypothetical protein
MTHPETECASVYVNLYYTLRASLKMHFFHPRPAGQSVAVVSATLRLLVLIAMDGLYACFAGAKTGQKKLLFLELLPSQSSNRLSRSRIFSV